jgi:hypothetical protein
MVEVDRCRSTDCRALGISHDETLFDCAPKFVNGSGALSISCRFELSFDCNGVMRFV